MRLRAEAPLAARLRRAMLLQKSSLNQMGRPGLPRRRRESRRYRRTRLIDNNVNDLVRNNN
jgi:hypothetical protein